MLYLLFFLTLFLVFINLTLSKNDYLHPASVVCEVFAIGELICMIYQRAYEITFHVGGIVAILLFLSSFTLIHFLYIKKNKGSYISNETIPVIEINISNYLLIGIIILQILSISAFIYYLNAISFAYDGQSRSLFELINLYDTMTKFWRTTFIELNVKIPMIYRIGNPIVEALGYFSIYVMVNNYVANKKVNYLNAIILVLMCILIILNGSRSPLLRIFTMIIILFYILLRRKNGREYINGKFYLRIGIVLLIFIVCMFLILFAMGRGSKIGDIGTYLFTYTGAPLVNLDLCIENNVVPLFNVNLPLVGEQTFINLYQYIGKLFHISSLEMISSINQFTYSANGIEIGNVYTTIYAFIYDFGYLGIIPLTVIISLYFINEYNQAFRSDKQQTIIDYRLFIFSYLFNDLIMLVFSNRFFDTVLNAPFIKILIITFLFVYVGIDNRSLIKITNKLKNTLMQNIATRD